MKYSTVDDVSYRSRAVERRGFALRSYRFNRRPGSCSWKAARQVKEENRTELRVPVFDDRTLKTHFGKKGEVGAFPLTPVRMPEFWIIAKSNSRARYKCIYAYFSDLGAVLVHI